jgi:hypothetical protein
VQVLLFVLGSPPRSSSTLHGHLVDMCGAIKKGIRIRFEALLHQRSQIILRS